VRNRDTLPLLEVLRVKISEEVDARKGVVRDCTSNAMFAGKRYKRNQRNQRIPARIRAMTVQVKVPQM